MKCKAAPTDTKERRDSLNDIVRGYVSEYRDKAARELRFYAIQRSLQDAIEKAALCQLPSGKRHDHQTRIPAASLSEADRRLQQRRAQIENCRTFEDLHALVQKEIDPIYKIGVLTVYDVAHRIGAYLGLEPNLVFLHAGTKKGAHSLGLDCRAGTLAINQLPKEFQKLKPYEIEDCLCIFQEDIKKVVQRGGRAYR